jgi:GNAT superfamily N-acetyltransferase
MNPAVDDITLRRCTAQDLDAVLELQKAWADEAVTYGYEPATMGLLAAAIGPYFVVAERDGTLVGFAYGSVHESEGLAVVPTGETFLSIEDLYVRPELRSGGVGGRILEQMMATARSDGVAKCVLSSATKDIRRAMGFYERHGFSSWTVHMFRPL